MENLNTAEPTNQLPAEIKLVQVDQALVMGIIQQRDQYHYHVSRVMAALPILMATLPQIKWMNLLSSIGLDFTAFLNPFGKKKKGVDVSLEQLQGVFNELISDHPHLQAPITDLISFWMTYKDINGPTDGITTE